MLRGGTGDALSRGDPMLSRNVRFDATDARFPIAETWVDAATQAARALQRRRHGLRLSARLTATLAGLGVATALAHCALDLDALIRLEALLFGLSVGCAGAAAIAVASATFWRLRLGGLVCEAEPALAGERRRRRDPAGDRAPLGLVS